MTNTNTLIFGGAFDPIHLGHLNVAKKVQDHFHFSSFLFLPSHIVFHKTPAQASAEQRIAMLQLALSDYPIENASICLDEIERQTPSYTIDTLRQFRKKLGNTHPITFMLGIDAFLDLPSWHGAADLLKFANFIVIDRHPSPASFSPAIQALVNTHEVFTPEPLLSTASGAIYFYDAGRYAISSKIIRAALLNKQEAAPYLSAQVYRFIIDNHLY